MSLGMTTQCVRARVPLPEAPVPKLTLLLIVAMFTISGVAQESHHYEMPAGGFGTVHFKTSCSAAVQPGFERAVAMLHSFGYEASRKAFEDVIQKDPDCAIAWWGVAMTHYHGLWQQI